MADDDDHRDQAETLQHGDEIHRRGGRRRHHRRRREQGREGDERNGGEILEQQHGEAEPAVARLEIAGLLHHLQGEGRRGQRQREAGEQRRLPGKSNQQADAGEHRSGQQDLRAAEPEYGVAHGPKPLRAQLQADQEQQQDDAELGEVQDLLRLVVGERPADRVGAEQHADDEVAEHGADAEPARQRPGDGEGGEQDRYLVQRYADHHDSPRPTLAACM